MQATGAAPALPAINREQHYALKLLAPRIPSGTGVGHIHASTLTKWIKLGVLSVSGQRVKLEAIRCGARWFVSMEAIDRFTAGLAAVRSAPLQPPPPGSAATYDEAVERLKAIGA
jgi:hypothetical protein